MTADAWACDKCGASVDGASLSWPYPCPSCGELNSFRAQPPDGDPAGILEGDECSYPGILDLIDRLCTCTIACIPEGRGEGRICKEQASCESGGTLGGTTEADSSPSTETPEA